MTLEKTLVDHAPLDEIASRLEIGTIQEECSRPAMANEQVCCFSLDFKGLNK